MRDCCGCRFPDREIEEPFRVLRASGKGKILCDVDLPTCGL
jgi:hypothetical protein